VHLQWHSISSSFVQPHTPGKNQVKEGTGDEYLRNKHLQRSSDLQGQLDAASRACVPIGITAIAAATASKIADVKLAMTW